MTERQQQMAVYVDTLKPADKCRTWPFDDRCRLFADSEQELEGMAASLMLDRKWRVDERGKLEGGGGLLFYPLTGGKRAQAVRLGAQTISTEMADALARTSSKAAQMAADGGGNAWLFGAGGGGRML